MKRLFAAAITCLLAYGCTDDGRPALTADQREDVAILRATTQLATAGPVRSHGAGGRDTPTGVSTREWTVADGVDPLAAFADLLRNARSSTLVWHDMNCGSGQISLKGAELLDGAVVGIEAYLLLDETPFNEARTITVRAEVGPESTARADRIPERAPLIGPNCPDDVVSTIGPVTGLQ